MIFDFTPERKIIISTNIAESSITIPDTKYVIDFCLVKQLKHSTYNDTESLELTWSSKASCDQVFKYKSSKSTKNINQKI